MIGRIVGVWLVAVGLAAVVSAAAMVTTALAVAAAGALAVLVGVLLVHLALQLERRQTENLPATPPDAPKGRRSTSDDDVPRIA